MKISFIIIYTLASLATTFAQGNVNWSAVPPVFFTAQTNTGMLSPYFGGGAGLGQAGGTQGAASLGTGYYFELLVGSAWNGAPAPVPTALGDFAAWTDSGLQATNSPNVPGRVRVVNANSTVTVNALSASVSNSIILVGWSANLGGTWAAALAHMLSFDWNGPAFFGVSNEGWLQGSSIVPGVLLFGSVARADGMPIFSRNTQLYLMPVLPVPEPAVTAFALFGTGLLLCRPVRAGQTCSRVASQTGGK